MAGLRGDVASLDVLRKRLSADPQVLAHKVAAAAVGAINAEAQRSFDAGEAPSGFAWPESKVTGAHVSLVRSGALRRQVRYSAEGSQIRCVLGVRYAKYQVGKRPVFPRRGAKLPDAYRDAIARVIAPIYSSFYGMTEAGRAAYLRGGA